MDYKLVWLEDRRASVMLEVAYTRQIFGNFTPVTTPDDAIVALEELDKHGQNVENGKNIVLIVDIMMDEVHRIKLPDGGSVETLAGYDAGYVLVDRHIRVESSKFRNASVLFLTARDYDTKLKGLIKELDPFENTITRVFIKGNDLDFSEFKCVIEGFAP